MHTKICRYQFQQCQSTERRRDVRAEEIGEAISVDVWTQSIQATAWVEIHGNLTKPPKLWMKINPEASEVRSGIILIGLFGLLDLTIDAIDAIDVDWNLFFLISQNLIWDHRWMAPFIVFASQCK